MYSLKIEILSKRQILEHLLKKSKNVLRTGSLAHTIKIFLSFLKTEILACFIKGSKKLLYIDQNFL